MVPHWDVPGAVPFSPKVPNRIPFPPPPHSELKSINLQDLPSHCRGQGNNFFCQQVTLPCPQSINGDRDELPSSLNPPDPLDSSPSSTSSIPMDPLPSLPTLLFVPWIGRHQGSLKVSSQPGRDFNVVPHTELWAQQTARGV